MKTIFALLAFAVSTSASSACYLIYTSANELVWQGSAPPVRMDTLLLDAEVQKRVPKGHLVIINDPGAPCPRLDLIAPRKTMRQKAEEMKND